MVKRLLSSTGEFCLRYYSVFLVLIMWEIVSRLGIVRPFLLPAFSTVLSRTWELFLNEDLVFQIYTTMFRMWSGLLLAAIVGVPLGIWMARFRPARAFFEPLISLTFPIPKIGIYPAIIIFFGIAHLSKISWVFIDSFFPIVMATFHGAQHVDKRLIWSARAMGTGEGEILRKIILPATLPSILTGIRLGIIVALIVVFLSEMIAGGEGLGAMMVHSARFFRSPDMFVSIILISALGLLFDRLSLMARRQLLRWHTESEVK